MTLTVSRRSLLATSGAATAAALLPRAQPSLAQTVTSGPRIIT